MVLQFLKSIENVQNFQLLSHENMLIFQTEVYLNSYYYFLEESMLFLLNLKWQL